MSDYDELARRLLKGKTLGEKNRRILELESLLREAEDERDSLRLELAAEKSVHRKDNEYLIAARDRLRR